MKSSRTMKDASAFLSDLIRYEEPAYWQDRPRVSLLSASASALIHLPITTYPYYQPVYQRWSSRLYPNHQKQGQKLQTQLKPRLK